LGERQTEWNGRPGCPKDYRMRRKENFQTFKKATTKGGNAGERMPKPTRQEGTPRNICTVRTGRGKKRGRKNAGEGLQGDGDFLEKKENYAEKRPTGH